MPSETSASSASTSTRSSSSVNSKPKSEGISKSPVTPTPSNAKPVGILAKVRALPVYIQLLGVMVVIAFVYVATNKKTLKFDFGKKKESPESADATTDEGDVATDDESEAESEAEAEEGDVVGTTTATPDKTVRFEADA